MVPDIACKGLCSVACTAIGMSQAEHKILSDKIGEPFPTIAEMSEDLADDPVGYRCPLLEDGRCTEHRIRPLVCRLWGVTEQLKCPHGCVPQGGHLPASEGSALMQVMLRIGGGTA